MDIFQHPRPVQRQADNSDTSSAADTGSSAQTSENTATTSSSGTATSTETDASSITSSASLSDASTSSSTDSVTSTESSTSWSLEDPPQHTKTVTTAYTAKGVNATSPAPKTTDVPLTSSSTTTSSTSSNYVDPAASAIASAKAPGVPPNELTACQINGTDPDNGPFCSPIHEQNLWVGYRYAITWNPSLFDHDNLNTAELRYLNGSLGNAWTSDPIPNVRGYMNVEMEKDWLRGASGNDSTLGQNMTLYMVSQPREGDNVTKSGPLLALIVNPKTLPRMPIKNLPAKYGLEIGVPIGVVAIVLILIGICCGIRKNNRHHRSIKGVSKDYMAKRARRRGKAGDIALEDYGDQYKDQPLQGGTGNVFRDEVAKQRQEDDASLRRMPSSY